MRPGDFVKVKSGASEWMKSKDYWMDSYPDSIDGLIGEVIFDYTHFKGDDAHYSVEIDGHDIGINPRWLEPALTKPSPTSTKS